MARVNSRYFVLMFFIRSYTCQDLFGLDVKFDYSPGMYFDFDSDILLLEALFWKKCDVICCL